MVQYPQAFIKTAAKILHNIQDGVFDVSNEVNPSLESVILLKQNTKIFSACDLNVVTLLTLFAFCSHQVLRLATGVLKVQLEEEMVPSLKEVAVVVKSDLKMCQ